MARVAGALFPLLRRERRTFVPDSVGSISNPAKALPPLYASENNRHHCGCKGRTRSFTFSFPPVALLCAAQRVGRAAKIESEQWLIIVLASPCRAQDRYRC